MRPLVLVLLAGCSEALAPLPPPSTAATALAGTYAPAHARTTMAELPPSDPAKLGRLLAEGFGAVVAAPGLTPVVRTLDGGPPRAPGPHPRLLSRFVHLADAQLADDESPSRVVSLDAIGATDAAYRPQEAWACHALYGLVRAVGAIHRERPIERVILGGDNADSAQRNEVAWVRAILNGGLVECDSGLDDDPLEGPSNDPKDPFVSEGLPMPWLWVTGNHDALVQGNLAVGPETRASALATEAPLGTRLGARLDAPTTFGPIAPDPDRLPLTPAELCAELAADGDGHGLAAPGACEGGKSFYAVGEGVRFVVLDTAAETGGAAGLLRRRDVEGRVKPLLDRALADGARVVLVSHHAAGSLGDGGGFAGAAQADTLAAVAWRDFVGRYPNVILHLAAHSHRFRSRVAEPSAGHRYFELQTASLSDWPGQAALLEIWDEDNGELVIRAEPIDYAEEGDPLAAEARRRAALDFTSGWSGMELEETGAVELHLPADPG